MKRLKDDVCYTLQRNHGTAKKKKKDPEKNIYVFIYM